MFKIASASGAPPQTPLRERTTLPRPLSRQGLLAFGNRSFTPSALAISRLTCLYAKNSKISASPESTPSAQHINFFTSNMSHYLKSLKICPAGLSSFDLLFSKVWDRLNSQLPKEALSPMHNPAIVYIWNDFIHIGTALSALGL